MMPSTLVARSDGRSVASAVMTSLWMALVMSLVLALGWPAQAWAHKPSDSHLLLQTAPEPPPAPGEAQVHEQVQVRVQWDLALRDLDDELGLDTDGDGQLTWGELRRRWPELVAWAPTQLQARSALGACQNTPSDTAGLAAPTLNERSDGRYASLNWTMTCPARAGQPLGALTVDYRFMARSDASHRGLVRLQDTGRQQFVAMGQNRPKHRFEGLQAMPPAHVPQASAQPTESITSIKPDDPARVQTPEAVPATTQDTPWQQVGRMVVEGVHHIAGGLDHILFLLTLLVVAVWRRTPGGAWQAQPTARAVWQETLKLVTAFTLSHSLTLTVAVMGWWNPPDRWVESLIALSVLLTAVDNLRPVLPGPRWVLVAVFGLVHGFGFAGALHESGLLGEQLLWPLLGFNLGVELGQLMLIGITLPLALWWRHHRVYAWVAVRAGSVAVAAAACVWLVERSTDTTLVAWVSRWSA